MFGLIKRTKIMGLLISIVNASNNTKCVSLSNYKCTTELTLRNLYPNEYGQEFQCYPFVVKLNNCVGSYIILLMTYPISICSK